MTSRHNQSVVEDIITSFKATQGQSWSKFHDKLSSVPIEDSKNKDNFELEKHITLSNEDIPVFGLIPRLDVLTLINCRKCSMVVKKDCIHYHYDLRHNDLENDNFSVAHFILPNDKTNKQPKRKMKVRKISETVTSGTYINSITQDKDTEHHELEFNKTQESKNLCDKYIDNAVDVNLVLKNSSTSNTSCVDFNSTCNPHNQSLVNYEVNDSIIEHNDNELNQFFTDNVSLEYFMLPTINTNKQTTQRISETTVTNCDNIDPITQEDTEFLALELKKIQESENLYDINKFIDNAIDVNLIIKNSSTSNTSCVDFNSTCNPHNQSLVNYEVNDSIIEHNDNELNQLFTDDVSLDYFTLPTVNTNKQTTQRISETTVTNSDNIDSLTQEDTEFLALELKKIQESENLYDINKFIDNAIDVNLMIQSSSTSNMSCGVFNSTCKPYNQSSVNYEVNDSIIEHNDNQLNELSTIVKEKQQTIISDKCIDTTNNKNTIVCALTELLTDSIDSIKSISNIDYACVFSEIDDYDEIYNDPVSYQLPSCELQEDNEIKCSKSNSNLDISNKSTDDIIVTNCVRQSNLSFGIKENSKSTQCDKLKISTPINLNSDMIKTHNKQLNTAYDYENYILSNNYTNNDKTIYDILPIRTKRKYTESLYCYNDIHSTADLENKKFKLTPSTKYLELKKTSNPSLKHISIIDESSTRHVNNNNQSLNHSPDTETEYEVTQIETRSDIIKSNSNYESNDNSLIELNKLTPAILDNGVQTLLSSNSVVDTPLEANSDNAVSSNGQSSPGEKDTIKYMFQINNCTVISSNKSIVDSYNYNRLPPQFPNFIQKCTIPLLFNDYKKDKHYDDKISKNDYYQIISHLYWDKGKSVNKYKNCTDFDSSSDKYSPSFIS